MHVNDTKTLRRLSTLFFDSDPVKKCFNAATEFYNEKKTPDFYKLHPHFGNIPHFTVHYIFKLCDSVCVFHHTHTHWAHISYICWVSCLKLYRLFDFSNKKETQKMNFTLRIKY